MTTEERIEMGARAEHVDATLWLGISPEKFIAWIVRGAILVGITFASITSGSNKEILSGIKTDMEAIRADVKQMKSDMASADKEASYQRGRIDGIERRVESNERRILNLESAIKK